MFLGVTDPFPVVRDDKNFMLVAVLRSYPREPNKTGLHLYDDGKEYDPDNAYGVPTCQVTDALKTNEVVWNVTSFYTEYAAMKSAKLIEDTGKMLQVGNYAEEFPVVKLLSVAAVPLTDKWASFLTPPEDKRCYHCDKPAKADPPQDESQGWKFCPNRTNSFHECSEFCEKRWPEALLRKMARCSRCKQAWYCGASCQRAAWSRHKLLCSLMNASPVAAKCKPKPEDNPSEKTQKNPERSAEHSSNFAFCPQHSNPKHTCTNLCKIAKENLQVSSAAAQEEATQLSPHAPRFTDVAPEPLSADAVSLLEGMLNSPLNTFEGLDGFEGKPFTKHRIASFCASGNPDAAMYVIMFFVRQEPSPPQQELLHFAEMCIHRAWGIPSLVTQLCKGSVTAFDSLKLFGASRSPSLTFNDVAVLQLLTARMGEQVGPQLSRSGVLPLLRARKAQDMVPAVRGMPGVPWQQQASLLLHLFSMGTLLELAVNEQADSVVGAWLRKFGIRTCFEATMECGAAERQGKEKEEGDEQQRKLQNKVAEAKEVATSVWPAQVMSAQDVFTLCQLSSSAAVESTEPAALAVAQRTLSSLYLQQKTEASSSTKAIEGAFGLLSAACQLVVDNLIPSAAGSPEEGTDVYDLD